MSDQRGPHDWTGLRRDHVGRFPPSTPPRCPPIASWYLTSPCTSVALPSASQGMRSTACREGGRPSVCLDVFPREPGGYNYMWGALGFCCHRAIRVPEGSSKMANHPWPGTSFFGAMIFPPALLIFSWYSSTEFTEM